MTRYIEPAELSKHVRRYKRRKEISPRLVELLRTMATGIHSRFRFIRDVDEFRQESLLWILKTDAIKLADPNQNCFNYFTKVICTCGRKMRAESEREYAMTQRYIESFSDDGLPPIATSDTFGDADQLIAAARHEARRPTKKRRSKKAKRKAGGSYRVTEVHPQCSKPTKKRRNRPRTRPSALKDSSDRPLNLEQSAP